MIRPASLADYETLVGIEQRCFETDRITRRQWRYMLTKAHADILVEENATALQGYVLVLYNGATSVARLYSIAIESSARGTGLAKRLVQAAEEAARDQARAYMRLEIRQDNIPSLRLFEGLGYRRFGVLDDYYEDHMQAVRFQKSLLPHLHPALAHMPFYEQTLEFTCGASALMMAMKALQPDLYLNRTLELRIWREANTIFMTSGHGGCGPFGLALAARQRGFDVAIFVNDPGVPLVDSVRGPDKKEVMRLVHEEMLQEVEELKIPVHYANLSLELMEEHFTDGAIPIVLISSYRIYGEKNPHWVVVSGFDWQVRLRERSLCGPGRGRDPHRLHQHRHPQAGILPHGPLRTRRFTGSGAAVPAQLATQLSCIMSEHILIVDKQSDWPEHFPRLPVVTAKDYLTGDDYSPQQRLHIVNLCRSYRYGSLGYYCSLLAEARGHRVIPTVRTIQDLSRRSIYSLMARDLDEQVESAISRQGLSPDTSRIKMSVFFGRSSFPELQDLAQQIYEGFHAPLLRIDFKYKSGWRIAGHQVGTPEIPGRRGEDCFRRSP